MLIHCSDGWDRTSQLTSLCQLLIDPYYRTLEGFCTLIEKEWVCFGHQFSLRNGISDNSWENKYSPIFLQWLDCVYQVSSQNPTKFEFNSFFIKFIAINLYNGLFGEFIYSNMKDRFNDDKLVSFFSKLRSTSLNHFKNPLYL